MWRQLFPQHRCTYCGYTMPPGLLYCPICARSRFRLLPLKKYQVAVALLILPFLLWGGVELGKDVARSAAQALAAASAPEPTTTPTLPAPTPTLAATVEPTPAPTNTQTIEPTAVPPTATQQPSPRPPTATPRPIILPSPTPAGPQIASLDLYNAANDRKIRTLAEGATIDLSRDGSVLTVIAIPASETETSSIAFTLNGQAPCEIKADGETPCLENVPPYALFGDNTDRNDYYEWDWTRLLGQNTLSAVACQLDGLQGACGPPYEITLTVTR